MCQLSQPKTGNGSKINFIKLVSQVYQMLENNGNMSFLLPPPHFPCRTIIQGWSQLHQIICKYFYWCQTHLRNTCIYCKGCILPTLRSILFQIQYINSSKWWWKRALSSSDPMIQWKAGQESLSLSWREKTSHFLYSLPGRISAFNGLKHLCRHAVVFPFSCIYKSAGVPASVWEHLCSHASAGTKRRAPK